VSWFRSSRRRRSESEADSAPAPAAAVAPRAELEPLPLADLHALAREAGVSRYRLLRRDALIDTLSGNGQRPQAPPAQASVQTERPSIRIEEAAEASQELAGQVASLVPQLSSSAARPSAADLERVVGQAATSLLVAREDGAVVGMLTLVTFRAPTGVRARVEDVVVDEGSRGRGVGEALVQEALRRASEGGARTVELTSRPQRDAANRMYERIGFRLRDTRVYRRDV
jgi:ribosomal protein S18 acetylase RimI-like enzyme